MEFVVQFEDNDYKSDQREKFMSRHLEFLEENADHILIAGPLVEAKWSLPAGGMWLVRSDTFEGVEDLIKRDPFWKTGLRKSVTVLQWSQVFKNGQRQSDK